MKALKFVIAVVLCVGVTACNSKPKEEDAFSVSIQGQKIIVGAWTVQDLYDNNYTVGYMEGDTPVSFTAEEKGEEEIESRSYYDDSELFYQGANIGTIEVTNASNSNINFLEGVVTRFHSDSSITGFDTLEVNETKIDLSDLKGTCDVLGGTYSETGIPNCTLQQQVAGKNNFITLGEGVLERDGSIQSVSIWIEKE